MYERAACASACSLSSLKEQGRGFPFGRGAEPNEFETALAVTDGKKEEEVEEGGRVRAERTKSSTLV